VQSDDKAEGRVAVEISAESAKRLIASIQSALDTGEREHALS